MMQSNRHCHAKRKRLNNNNSRSASTTKLVVVVSLSSILFLPICYSYCPASLANYDGTYYVSDISILDNAHFQGCGYEYSGNLPSDDVHVGIVGSFSCNDCVGSIINPNFWLWDDEDQHNNFDETIPECSTTTTTLSSCNLDEISKVCNITKSNDYICGKGYFACQRENTKEESCRGIVVPPTTDTVNSTSSEALICPETVTGEDELDELFSEDDGEQYDIVMGDWYRVWNDFAFCSGKVKPPQDFDCPPSVVSSSDELSYYCFHGWMSSGNSYSCDWYGDIVCHGTIDRNKDIPACHQPTLLDCSEEQYFAVCAHEENAIIESMYCNADGTFTCWDKVDNQWCQGKIIPSYYPGASFDNPICPKTAIPNSGALYGYGIAGSCSTVVGIETGSEVGSFECYDSNNEVWCEGTIDGRTAMNPTSVFPGNDSGTGKTKDNGTADQDSNAIPAQTTIQPAAIPTTKGLGIDELDVPTATRVRGNYVLVGSFMLVVFSLAMASTVIAGARRSLSRNSGIEYIPANMEHDQFRFQLELSNMA